MLTIFITAHFGVYLTERKHILTVKFALIVITEGLSNSISVFSFSAVRKMSTDALQLVVERCAAASSEGPCDKMITVLR